MYNRRHTWSCSTCKDFGSSMAAEELGPSCPWVPGFLTWKGTAWLQNKLLHAWRQMKTSADAEKNTNSSFGWERVLNPLDCGLRMLSQFCQAA